jgi:hypothetical protein
MKAFFDSLSLRAKLLLIMFCLLLLTLASLFVLYWQAERALILQVEKHTMDLSQRSDQRRASHVEGTDR